MTSNAEEYGSGTSRPPLPGLVDCALLLWRRRLIFIAALVPLIALCALAVSSFTPTYRAAATILIEDAAFPENVASRLADTRLQLISRRAQTTEYLVGIARQNGMYAEFRANSEAEGVPEGIVNAGIAGDMRGSIGVETIRAEGTEATLAFVLSYEHPDPQIAQQVTERLVALYIAENEREIAKMVEQTSGILSPEVANYRRVVSDLEARLAEFREANSDLLPHNVEAHMRTVERIEGELLNTDRQLQTLREQRVNLGSALAQVGQNAIVFAQDGTRVLDPARLLVAKRSELAALSSRYSPTHPNVIKLRAEIATLEAEAGAGVDTTEMEARLSTLRSQLAEARGRYTQDHPIVTQLTSEIASLERDFSEAVRRGGPASTSTPDNPEYIAIRSQLQGVEAEIQHYLGTQEALRERMAEYREKIAQGPGIGSQLTALERQYEEALTLYQEFVGRGVDAEMAGKIEQQLAQFVVIEPAVLPTQPMPPSRKILMLLGLLVSLGAAFGVAFLRDYTDNSVRSASDLTVLGVPLLATIPVFDGAGSPRRFPFPFSFSRSG